MKKLILSCIVFILCLLFLSITVMAVQPKDWYACFNHNNSKCIRYENPENGWGYWVCQEGYTKNCLDEY
jgi:hypothetical protein